MDLPAADRSTPAPFPDVYWVEPGLFLAGPYPGFRSAGTVRSRVLGLLDAGVRLFLDLTEAGTAPPYVLHLAGKAQHIRLSIPDFAVPSFEGMVHILDVLDQAIASKHPVYLHCLGGLGRTGTVVGCYWVRRGLSGVEALQHLDVLRRSAVSAGCASPETDAQRRMVLQWHK